MTMLSFSYDRVGNLYAVNTEYVNPRDVVRGHTVIDRHDIDSWEQAEQIAKDATALTGRTHVATETPNRRPRFDVIEAPDVGDKVSRGFNGDYYPDGVITHMSPTLKCVKTSGGHTFRRRGRTGSWVSKGTWGLVPGHRDERNPHL